MAYFIRNGLVLAGVNSNPPIVLAENKTDSVKYDYIKPLIVKAPIKNDTVKYDTKNNSVKCAEENTITTKDKDLETILARFTQAIEHKFMATIDTVKQELTVKYDKHILQQELSVIPHFTAEQEITAKPLCKPIAFGAVINAITKDSSNNCTPCQSPIVKYDTTTISNPSPKENSSKPTEIEPSHETHQPVNSIELADIEEENETEQEEEITLHQIIKEKQADNILPNTKKIMEQNEDDDTPYKWIESKLMRYLDQKYMNDNAALKLLEPMSYWDYEKVLHIKWINIRLRCLIESLIRLSNYSRIDTHTMLCVSDAFTRLLKSNAYKNLPSDYPYKELIAELGIKVNEIAEQNRNAAQLIFCLPLMRKAQLLTIRHQMLANVPAMKFSELDFTEEGNHLEIIKSDEGDEETERRRPRDTWRRKLRAIKREREQNKAADKNKPLENITQRWF